MFCEIINIMLFHSFFEGSVCSGLDIVPDSNTQKIFENSRTIIRNKVNGISISGDSGFTSALEAYSSEGEQLMFKIKLADPYFFYYTDLPHNRDNIIVLDFINAKRKGDEYILSEESIVSTSDVASLEGSSYLASFRKEERISPPVGLILIKLEDIPIKKIGDDDFSPINICVNFKAKSTYWRYNLIDINNHNFDELYIKDANKKIGFTYSGTSALPNGQLAHNILSKSPVSLKERFQYHFKLFGKKDNHEVLIMNKLSFPDYKFITKDDNRFISEIYVYF